MAGTLLLLREAGWEIHYLNLSTGNLGSMTLLAARDGAGAAAEAQAAALLGATWHRAVLQRPGDLLRRSHPAPACAVIREVDPRSS